MKLNWKDFLYFPKGDRNAIILLLLLIVVCGSLSIVAKSYWIERSVEEQRKALSEFDKFHNDTSSPLLFEEDMETTEFENTETMSNSTKKKTKTEIKKLQQGETIELNGASISILKRIPGVGDEYAKRILEYRNQLGGLTSLEQLTEIKGITQKRFTNISSYVSIQKKVKQIGINKVSKDILLRHPYLNEKQVEAILIKREEGKIQNLEDLKNIQGFTPRDIDRLKEYLSFN